jgi:hypothetical protein
MNFKKEPVFNAPALFFLEQNQPHFLSPSLHAGVWRRVIPGWEQIAYGSGETAYSLNAGAAGAIPAKPPTKK